MKKIITTTVKSAVAAALCAAALVGAAPTSALATFPITSHSAPLHTASLRAAHEEGASVTIGDNWGQPVYAQWHQGASGRWWAVFWTYNGTMIWACPSDAACGWSFFCYDDDGDFVQVVRSDESVNYGMYGPAGVSSHWQELGTWNWF